MIRRYINNLIINIKNLIYWFPVIWDDRDYDYVFILRIEMHKINSIIKRYEKTSYYVGQEDNLRYLLICRDILGLLTSDYMHEGYVNIKNSDIAKRLQKEMPENKELLEKLNSDIWEDKAVRLYYKIKSEHLLKLWD